MRNLIYFPPRSRYFDCRFRACDSGVACSIPLLGNKSSARKALRSREFRRFSPRRGNHENSFGVRPAFSAFLFFLPFLFAESRCLTDSLRYWGWTRQWSGGGRSSSWKCDKRVSRALEFRARRETRRKRDYAELAGWIGRARATTRRAIFNF